MRPTHLIVALAPNLAQTGCGNTPGGSGATSAGSPAGNGPYEQFARALESRADCPLWTLHRNGQTARAEIVNIEGVGLELRYTRNRKPLVRRTSTDGAELLRDAAIERFELEALGWR
jgi:hypothetical protein